MLEEKYIKYKPKGTVYQVIFEMKHSTYGNLVFYATCKGEVYVRTDNDFEKFEDVKDDFIVPQPQKKMKVKFKLNGQWEDFYWYKFMFLPFEQYIDARLDSLETAVYMANKAFKERHKYYLNINPDIEKGMISKGKLFYPNSPKEARIKYLDEKVDFIRKKINKKM